MLQFANPSKISFQTVCLMLTIIATLSVSALNKPSPLSYSADLNFLIQGLQTYHPNPWRYRAPRAFRQELTQNPVILSNWPLGPMMSIARSLNQLDPYAEDNATYFNLLEQPIEYHFLPFELLAFGERLFVEQVGDTNSTLLGSELIAINGTPIKTLAQRLNPYVVKTQPQQIAKLMASVTLLNFVGADCYSHCELSFKLATLEEKEIRLTATDFLPTPLANATLPETLYQRFRLRHPQTETAYEVTDKTLYWIFGKQLLESTEAFELSYKKAKPLLADQALEALILDLRGVTRVNSDLLRKVWHIIRPLPKRHPNLSIFALIDESVSPKVYPLIADLDSIPELRFVGTATASAISYFHDRKRLSLPNTGFKFSVASRYQITHVEADNKRRFQPDFYQYWQAMDFYRGQDSILARVLEVIEIERY